jgi:hypothetical protein
VARRFLLAQALGDLVAVELRHHHVEERKVGGPFERGRQGLLAVACSDDLVPRPL